jgi:Antibiotic biosynthesis monooxygenase
VPTDGNRELLTVIAFMRAAPGKREELKAALEALIEPTKQEDGYVNYDLHQGVEDPISSPSARTGSRATSSTRTSPHRTSSTSPPRWVTSSSTTPG